MTPATLVLAIFAAVAVAGAWLWARRRADLRRRQAVGALLDAADALEARLRQAREEIEAVAGQGDTDPVRDALQEMLRQRLWLQRHGDRASLADIAAVRGSIEAASARVDQQLLRIERARAPLH